jgi:hypothetical protein
MTRRGYESSHLNFESIFSFYTSASVLRTSTECPFSAVRRIVTETLVPWANLNAFFNAELFLIKTHFEWILSFPQRYCSKRSQGPEILCLIILISWPILISVPVWSWCRSAVIALCTRCRHCGGSWRRFGCSSPTPTPSGSWRGRRSCRCWC